MQNKHQKLIDTYKREVSEALKKYPDSSNSEITRRLNEEYGVPVNFDYLRVAIGEYRKEENVEDPSIELNAVEDKKYSVSNDGSSYFWGTKRGSMKFTVGFIDEIFFEYSEHGQDLSQTEMINKHNLEVWQWNSIKSTFMLFKKSNVFSPHTMDNTSREKLEEMIKEKVSKKFDNPQLVIEKIYQKGLNRAHKKVITDQSKQDFMWRRIMSDLGDLLPHSSATKSVNIVTSKQSDIETLVVPIADLHVGAKVEGISALRDYDSKEIRRRVRCMIDEINTQKASKVVLAFIGDLIESFTGANHPNSWQSMEWGMYGAPVIKNVIEVMEMFIQGVNNVSEVVGVAGNHDRGDSNRNIDTKGEIAEVIFYFIQRMYGNTLTVEFESDVLSKDYDGFQYIFTHGHSGHSSKSREGKDLVLQYGDNSKYNIIITGHWHSRDIPHDSSIFRWIICPSIFGGNDYSNRLGFWTNPGYVMMYRKGSDGSIRVIDDSF